MQFGSFILLFLGGTHVVLLILAIIVLDIGTQFGQVANQTRVQNLGEEASNRNNTVFMFFYFIVRIIFSLYALCSQKEMEQKNLNAITSIQVF